MKPKKTILKNGLRVVTVPLKDNPTATVLVLVEAGSKYESKEISGISHFLEHLCFKGTEKRPTALAISHELDGLGAQTNAFTGHEFTGYYAKAEAKKLPKLLDIIADLYVNPTLPDEEIQKEKGVIVDEISMYEDMPHRDVQHIFMELLYGEQPAGWNIAGTKEIVRALTRENIVDYRTKHYVAERTTVVIAGGGLDNKKTITAIEKKFEKMPTGKGGRKVKVKESQKGPQVKVKVRDTDQTHIMMGVRTYGQKNKDGATLKVLGALLGGGMSSRLFQRLRDQMGVGYYVYASHDVFTDHGFMSMNTGVNNEMVKDVVKAIVEELDRLKTELVSDEELKKVKEYLSGNTLLGLESSDSLAEYYGISEILDRPLKTPQEKIKEVKAVTAKDIQKVARKIFTNDRLNLALIGPKQNMASLKKVLNFKK